MSFWDNLIQESGLVIRIAEFIDLKRLCCPFFNFTVVVEPDGGPLWLKLTSRAGVKQFLLAELLLVGDIILITNGVRPVGEDQSLGWSFLSILPCRVGETIILSAEGLHFQTSTTSNSLTQPREFSSEALRRAAEAEANLSPAVGIRVMTSLGFCEISIIKGYSK
jgi:hypothetical protein